MNRARSRSDDGGEEASSQDLNHENERRWQQERLHREEAYYQFINDLNDEDYRLMRDHNLLGTPGEITSEELQQRLDGVKEQLASQPNLRGGTNTRGMRTYVSTITVPLRRISENELVEPSSVALRSILRQIMTGFGELSSLMEAESESELQRSGRHLPEMHPEMSNLGIGNAIGQHSDGSSRGQQDQEDSPEMRGGNVATPPRAPSSDGRGGRQVRNSNNLVETGTLPILRLAHFFLLNEGDDEDRIRGLTKEQIDNLSTRNYEHSSAESEPGRICSVCISDYVTGNKLRQLPCMHEFHIHCIDRWLSENCTCPICRQPVLGSSIANDG
ncbi:E3 ubiquitin-protein ligase RNF6 [Camelus dromedarius]|uniref:RING-type E3 ubiquitin transferase n=1 Tax=Camelus dromedarius TaxID=9838 RepID=A0A5N4D9V3_CAMDR|nr:E3 ubiquitin-protein ligase RNF6 [Camelus dromedarius]